MNKTIRDAFLIDETWAFPRYEIDPSTNTYVYDRNKDIVLYTELKEEVILPVIEWPVEKEEQWLIDLLIHATPSQNRLIDLSNDGMMPHLCDCEHRIDNSGYPLGYIISHSCHSETINNFHISHLETKKRTESLASQNYNNTIIGEINKTFNSDGTVNNLTDLDLSLTTKYHTIACDKMPKNLIIVTVAPHFLGVIYSRDLKKEYINEDGVLVKEQGAAVMNDCGVYQIVLSPQSV